MTPDTGGTTQLLRQVRAGDVLAHNALIAHARQRLLALTSYMLRRYDGVRRWEHTDDVLQSALIRLWKALTDGAVPNTSAHYWNLAQAQIRRELIDLSRRYDGKRGIGANHHSDGAGRAADDPGGPLHNLADPCAEPETLEAWAHFHEAVGRLPEDEQQVFGLIWYTGLSQTEVAEELDISLKTVGRRWCSARLRLARALRGELLPEDVEARPTFGTAKN